MNILWEVPTAHGLISLAVVRSARRTVQLSVSSGGQVVLRAPLSAANVFLQDIINKKSDWIVRVRNRLLQSGRPVSFDCNDGAFFYVQGHKKYLRIIASDRESPYFEDGPDEWRLLVPRAYDSSRCEVAARQALALWVDRSVRDYLAGRVDLWCLRMGLRPPLLTIRRQRRLWGSCNFRRRSLSFNRALFAFPSDVIDYVVVHELCHLTVPAHSAAFWREVARWCPDWRKYRSWLKTESPGYFLP
jgi:predicted metal-dependent hydrolase